MSGHERTYVSVPDQELRRLQEQESRLRSLTSDLPERLEAIRRQTQREMESRMAPIERRIQQQEQETKSMQGQIDSIIAEARQKKDTAQKFFVDLTKILEETNKLPHTRFAPGKLDAIRRHVEDAKRNYEGNMPEASLSTAQKSYWDIADLQTEVLKLQREFMLVHQTALQEARLLLEEACANRKRQLGLGQGSDKEILDLEVDHWTRGELSAYETEVKALENQLVNGENTLTAEQVKGILDRIETLKPKLEEIVERARQNILASHLRVNIADLVVDALKDQGFFLQEATYEGGDDRNSFIAKVAHRDGSEVVTIISPVEGEVGKNAVSIHSFDETYVDDETLRQRAKEIVSILKEEGLEADAPKCEGKAKSEYKDIEAVKQGSTLKTPEQRKMYK